MKKYSFFQFCYSPTCIHNLNHSGTSEFFRICSEYEAVFSSMLIYTYLQNINNCGISENHSNFCGFNDEASGLCRLKPLPRVEGSSSIKNEPVSFTKDPEFYDSAQRTKPTTLSPKKK